MKHFLQGSLRWTVILAILAPLTVFLGIFTYLEYREHLDTIQKNIAIMASKASNGLETNLHNEFALSDFEGVQNLLHSSQVNEGFQKAYIIDTQGKIIFSSQNKDKGVILNKNQSDCAPCHQLSNEHLPTSVMINTRDGNSIFRIVTPIENGPDCVKCHDPGQPILGYMLADISTAAYKESLDLDLKENLLWRVMAILVSLLVVSLALDRFVFRRLENFTKAIQDFGKLEQAPHLASDQPDEIGKLFATFQSMASQIETRNLENQRLSDDLKIQSEARGDLLKRLITAQENERSRVARELHDGLGQALTGLSLQTEVMQKCIKEDSERAREQIKRIQELISDTTNSMYDLILDLRPSVLDDLGLVAAIRAQAERDFARHEITYELDDSQLTGRLPAELETVLYRIFQECLSNVIRHAKATRVQIKLSRLDGCFKGEIEDNGQGFDLEAVQGRRNPHNVGLLGVHERVSQWFGKLEIISEPGAGTRIIISIPIKETQIEQ